MQGELRGFRVEATSTEVVLFPVEQFDDYRDALRAADRLARDWEQSSALQHGEGAFKLHRESSEEIGPHGRRTRRPAWSNALDFSSTTLAEAKPDQLPTLPAGISFEGAAGLMLERLNSAMDGRELLLGAGYYILTEAEKAFGGRKKAAAVLGMGKTLDVLGNITANAGGPLEGRKARSVTPLTREDKRWVQDTCREIILRVARHEGGSDPGGKE